MDGENLGPSEPWQLRSFPRALREQLIDEAHAKRITVGDLLTSIVLAHYGSNNTSSGADTTNNALRLVPVLPYLPAWFRFRLARKLAPIVGIEAPEVRRRLPAPDRLR